MGLIRPGDKARQIRFGEPARHKRAQHAARPGHQLQVERLVAGQGPSLAGDYEQKPQAPRMGAAHESDKRAIGLGFGQPVQIEPGTRLELAALQPERGCAIDAGWRGHRGNDALCGFLFRRGNGLSFRESGFARAHGLFEQRALFVGGLPARHFPYPGKSRALPRCAATGRGNSTYSVPSDFVRPATRSAFAPKPKKMSPRTGPLIAPPVSWAISRWRNGWSGLFMSASGRLAATKKAAPSA